MSEVTKSWLGHVADIVTVICLSALIYFDKLDAVTGVVLIGLIAGAKLPSKGAGGAATLMAPFLGLKL